MTHFPTPNNPVLIGEKPLGVAEGDSSEGFLGDATEFSGLGKDEAEVGGFVQRPLVLNEAGYVYVVWKKVGCVGFDEDAIVGYRPDGRTGLFGIRASDGTGEGDIGSAPHQFGCDFRRTAKAVDKHAARQLAGFIQQYEQPAPCPAAVYRDGAVELAGVS